MHEKGRNPTRQRLELRLTHIYLVRTTNSSSLESSLSRNEFTCMEYIKQISSKQMKYTFFFKFSLSYSSTEAALMSGERSRCLLPFFTLRTKDFWPAKVILFTVESLQRFTGLCRLTEIYIHGLKLRSGRESGTWLTDTIHLDFFDLGLKRSRRPGKGLSHVSIDSSLTD